MAPQENREISRKNPDPQSLLQTLGIWEDLITLWLCCSPATLTWSRVVSVPGMGQCQPHSPHLEGPVFPGLGASNGRQIRASLYTGLSLMAPQDWVTRAPFIQGKQWL